MSPYEVTPVTLVNLLGHQLTIQNNKWEVVLESRGRARVSSKMKRERMVAVDDVHIPLLIGTESDVIGLPEPVEGVLYVVSGIVAANAARAGRVDVVTPSRLERVDGGRVKSCRALLRIVG